MDPETQAVAFFINLNSRPLPEPKPETLRPKPKPQTLNRKPSLTKTTKQIIRYLPTPYPRSQSTH